MNNKYFKSGEEYTLTDFLSGDNKIIIPDLQRDYCWGNTIDNKQNLVALFISSLIDLFISNPSEPFTLGLIYGYELDDKGLKGHTHLCDGQQRITTLFLLIGMLNRKTDGKFQHRLISDYELNEDGQEPYLQYAIRESTLYFLSDLVCEFFLKNDIKAIDEIEKEDWFFDDYKLDASITSMLKALKQIDEKLTEVEDLATFGKFICEKLQLLYYDMGNRAQGEETFVIINKTGEPLTPTENLKPKYISLLESDQEQASIQWEEWENFFWINRTGGGKMKNDTADKGFLEFLRWITLLNSEKEVFDEIREGSSFDISYLKVEVIHEYFEIVRFAFGNSVVFPNNRDWLAPIDKNDQIVWFKILPVIEYIKRFGKDDIRNILRVKQFFKNRARNSNVRKDIAHMLPLAIQVIKDLPSADIADLLKMEGVSETLLTTEERLKFSIYQQVNNREDVENAIWAEEGHNIWDGEIDPILKWSGGTLFNLALFQKYSKVFSVLFHDTLEYEELDIVRRALLTRNLQEYPKIFSGYTNYSFCWHYSDWKILINENIVEFGKFFSELFGTDNLYHTLDTMIAQNPNNKDYDEFVKIPQLLEYCERKNIQWSDNEGWVLIKGERRSGAYVYLKSYRLFLHIVSNSSLARQGRQVWFYGNEGGALVVENKEQDIVIDSFFVKMNDEKDLYQLQFFKRDKDKTYNELANIAQKNELKFNEHNRRYESSLADYTSIVELINTLICEAEDTDTVI